LGNEIQNKKARPKEEKKFRITRKGVLTAWVYHFSHEIANLRGERETTPLRVWSGKSLPDALTLTFHSMIVEYPEESLLGGAESRLERLRPDINESKRRQLFWGSLWTRTDSEADENETRK